MGLIHEDRGELETAKDYYLKALQLNPDHKPLQKALNRLQNI